MRPCAAPIRTIPRYIRKKKILKICDLAKANTTIPANLVMVIPDRTYRRIQEKE